jgi:hypothetical protein
MASLIPVLALLVVGGAAAFCVLSIPHVRQALVERFTSHWLDEEPDSNESGHETENPTPGGHPDRERECFDTDIFRE